MRFFKKAAPDVQELEGPFFKTVTSSNGDFQLRDVRYDLDTIVSVKPKRRDPDSYIMATRHEGDSIAAGAWTEGVKLVALRGKPVGKHPRDDRLELFQRVVVEQFLPVHMVFGDNGTAVLQFVDELGRRGEPGTPQSERISASAWDANWKWIQEHDRNPNRNELSRGAWNAAYAIAKVHGMAEACDAASEIAKQMAMQIAHLSEVLDKRDAAPPGSPEWQEAQSYISARVTGFEAFPGVYRSEPKNIAAGLCTERATVALVMQKHLAPGLFAALTEPFRVAIDSSMFGLL
jgi:hypothetical protein